MNIKLKDITKRYEDTTVLNKFNIEFKEHAITCIMGSSGVGKTTLIHMLMGLVKADAGVIEGLEGKKITAVFQEDRLCDGIDAIKNIQLVCDKKVTEYEIERELHAVGLLDYKNKPVAQLSGGMKSRVAIVRALLPESDIVIMDEPFKGLNEELKGQVIDYVRRKTKGKTVIIVTHDKDEVEALLAELVSL